MKAAPSRSLMRQPRRRPKKRTLKAAYLWISAIALRSARAPHADLRDRSLAHTVFRGCALPGARPHSDGRLRCMDVEPASSLGVRPRSGRTKPGTRRGPARHDAVAVSRVLEADRQPEGDGARYARP